MKPLLLTLLLLISPLTHAAPSQASGTGAEHVYADAGGGRLERALALQEAMQARWAEQAAAEQARSLVWADRWNKFWFAVLVIVGVAIPAMLVLWLQNFIMGLLPRWYHQDELDALVAKKTPTEAQATLAHALSLSVACRRLSFAIVVAGGCIAVGISLA